MSGVDVWNHGYFDLARFAYLYVAHIGVLGLLILYIEISNSII